MHEVETPTRIGIIILQSIVFFSLVFFPNTVCVCLCVFLFYLSVCLSIFHFIWFKRLQKRWTKSFHCSMPSTCFKSLKLPYSICILAFLCLFNDEHAHDFVASVFLFKTTITKKSAIWMWSNHKWKKTLYESNAS